MIFGTDGIRGRFGVAPMDTNTILKISTVLGRWLPENGVVVLGSDTRKSGGEIRKALASRLGNVRLLDLGVVPTPVVAYETKARQADLGIMITASHNPAHDNGLKFFNKSGLKMEVTQARAWSDDIEAMDEVGPETPAEPKPAIPENYRAFILQNFKPEQFSGQKMAFDLAHGAGSPLVKDLAEALNLDAVFIGDQPNGENINDNVGALHPDNLAKLVADRGLTAGFALDGDGDRLIMTDTAEIPGDAVIYALSRVMTGEGKDMSVVVGTIMCGMGLEQALEKDGIKLVRTAVGDQNVLKAMKDENLLLGGEPSGHIIQGDLLLAGDGFLAALRIASALKEHPGLLQDAKAALPKYEAFEKSYKVGEKPPIESVPELAAYIEAFRKDLDGKGRLIIRYSGTEPKIRVYVEARSLDTWRERIDGLVAVIGETLG